MPAVSPSRGDVVLLTGCSDGGIGAGLCSAFHAAGCTVYATARRPASMAGLVAAHPGIHTLPLDVTNPESVKAAVEAVVREAGRIDILVNNAGMGLVAPLAEVDIEKSKEVYEANVWGTLRMVQAVAPHMAARRSGTVCNVGSVVGYFSTPWGAIYSSSKAAVHAMTDALRLELKPFGIKVMLLAPGAVRSNIGDNNLKRFDTHFSLYAPFADVIRERAVISQGGNSMPTDQFARAVVARLLSPSPPRHFLIGGFVRLTQFALWWPLWLRDYVLAKKFKVNTTLPPPPPPALDATAATAAATAAAEPKKAL